MYCQTSPTATSSFAHRGLSLSNTCATNRFLGVDSKFEIPKNTEDFYELACGFSRPDVQHGLELGRGRGISNLDKKARITRPAPLI